MRLRQQTDDFSMRCLLAGVAGLALLLPGLCEAQTSVVERLAPDQPTLVMSHLGNNGGFLEGGYPENSLAAIRHAIELGVDGVYLPIQVTRDGRYVLMHDATLNATTNVEEAYPEGPPGRSRPMTGRRMDFISDYTLAEIRQLRLTDGQDGGDHRVPRLEEALALIDGQVLVTVSLKTYELESLSALLATQETENLLAFSTTDNREALEVSVATGIKAEADLGACCRKDPVAGLQMLAEMFGPDLVMASADKPLPSAELIEKASELGIRLSVYPRSEDYYLTKGNIAPWEEVLEGGATAFMTDHPRAILDLMDR
jgi:glycerophosphoryl diester phosphodiesterase